MKDTAKKPILVIMAAGMGSRFGGLKQIEAVGPAGEAILDYSLFDAHRAGFETFVFIIKHAIEDAFKSTVGARAEKAGLNVRYAYQELDILPEGFTVPEGRIKPWGTAHAILSAADAIDAPFAVINADDYYGRTCFEMCIRDRFHPCLLPERERRAGRTKQQGQNPAAGHHTQRQGAAR